MSLRPSLHALAAHVGILDHYLDQAGTRRDTTDATRVALLAAMGLEAGSEHATRESLAQERARHAAARSAVRVVDARHARIVAAPRAARTARWWTVEVTREDGERITAHARTTAGPSSIRLQALPLGYHRLRITWTDAAGREQTAAQRLIVVPRRCLPIGAALGRRRVYGLLANLYTVRSASNWGIGDAGDLRRLVEWAADVGAAFVGINPLHALHNRGVHISPYSPVSRLYRNPLYIDVDAVPEWRALSESRRRALADAGALATLRAAPRIDYAAVCARKMAALTELHRAFVARERRRPSARGRAYRAYLRREGDALRAFATYLALHEHFAGTDGDPRPFPAAYRDPNGPAVRAFAAQAATAIDRHRYLQFELERQLGTVAARASARGMALGVYQDLAIGSAANSSDAWTFPGMFVEKASIGAPPDDYSSIGQNWQLPPLDPRALTASGYELWVRLLRAAMRHAGAIRIDHVMGLFRQYWIPAGGDGRDGAYIRFPSADLLGILALESQRAGALVIGEDLGTVPRGLPAVLARWGILSTRVLYFQRTRAGGFLPAAAYPARALVAANTHDLAPLAGFWEGRDIALRRAAGMPLGDEAETQRARDRAALLRRLRRQGLLPRTGHPPEIQVRAGVHALLDRTPAALFGLSLDDCTGERDPVNLPGVPLDRYPSWSRRMRLPLEQLATDPGVTAALDGLPSGPRALGRRPKKA